MKKLLLAILCTAGFLGLKAQNSLYNKLTEMINEKGIATNNKLIGVTVWSINNKEERNNNLAFDKAMRVYEFAKLKGGEKGLVMVSVCRNGWNGETTIVFNKDGNTKLIPLDNTNAIEPELLPTSNLLFDCQGNMLYNNLKADEVFTAIHKLITR